MAKTVRNGIPEDLYARLKKMAAGDAPLEVEPIRELVRCLEKTAPRRGRPKKAFVERIQDALLDYLVVTAVQTRQHGSASQVIAHLKKREPFKSAGDLRSRYNRHMKQRRRGKLVPLEFEVLIDDKNGGSAICLRGRKDPTAAAVIEAKLKELAEQKRKDLGKK